MGDTRKSSDVNKGVLLRDLGLKQLSNTTIFIKNNTFVLSPSVQNSYSWFDIRKVNLERFYEQEKVNNGYLLIRYFNVFLLTELNKFISTMLSEDKYVENKNIGIHWKLNVFPSGKGYKIINRQEKSKFISVGEIAIDELKKII